MLYESLSNCDQTSLNSTKNVVDLLERRWTGRCRRAKWFCKEWHFCLNGISDFSGSNFRRPCSWNRPGRFGVSVFGEKRIGAFYRCLGFVVEDKKLTIKIRCIVEGRSRSRRPISWPLPPHWSHFHSKSFEFKTFSLGEKTSFFVSRPASKAWNQVDFSLALSLLIGRIFTCPTTSENIFKSNRGNG